MVTTIAYNDWNAARDNARTVEITYTRRLPGKCPQGWHVRRADNGRLLGWVIGPKEAGDSRCWIAYAADDAFRGDDLEDEGDLLDQIPEKLTRRGSGWHTIAGGTRLDVTETLIQELCRARATALGFGRHPDVTRHHADRPALREWFKNGMAGPYPHDR